MSDPTAELQPAIEAAIRADAGVASAFGSNRVKVYDVPPTNGVEPYVVIGEDDVLPDDAEGLDGVTVDSTLHVWAKGEPPGKAAAKRIGAALVALFAPGDDEPPALTLDGFLIKTARLVRAAYLTDPGRPQTTHGVVVVRFRIEPL